MKRICIGLLTLCFPLISFGAAPTDFKGLVELLIGLINQLFLILIALTFFVLVWGIVKGWILHGGDVESIEKGKHVFFAGIIVFVILGSLWGILGILRLTFFSS